MVALSSVTPHEIVAPSVVTSEATTFAGGKQNPSSGLISNFVTGTKLPKFVRSELGLVFMLNSVSS